MSPQPNQPSDRRGGRPDAAKKSGGKPGGKPGGPTAKDREADAEAAALVALRQKLSGLLKRLPDVERRVIELRMGLVDGTPAKPGEVADRLGMTIPEVKKIEARAFSRIREVGPIKGLERFLTK
jgi:DNA-directed RNA polymerase sigma subunit (sigma70/sigma32)